MQAEPITSTSYALIRAFDNAACWLRYTDAVLTANLLEASAKAFKKEDTEALVKIIQKVTVAILALLPGAMEAGIINGKMDLDEDSKLITRSSGEFSAEVDEIFCCFAMTCCETPNGLRDFVKILLSHDQCPEIILRVLLAIFNFEDSRSKMKAELFTQACAYACRANLFERAVCQPVATSGLQWLDGWDLTDEERAKIAFDTALMLENHKHAEDCAKWRLYGLTKSKEEQPEIVSLLLASKVKAEDEFLFDEVISLPAVKAVKEHKDVKVLYSLCREFYEGDLKGLHKIFRSNEKYLTELGFDEEALRFKMLVISLASVGAKTLASSEEARQLSHEVVLDLADLSELLESSPEQIERAAAAAIAYGILQGKLNQQFNTLTVHAGLHRKFEKEQWKEVLDRLETWRSTLLQVEQRGIITH